MIHVYTKHGSHHLRIYASVDIKTGKPLRNDVNGKPIRKQQTVKLAEEDDVHRSKNSPAVLKLAIAKQEEILAWEKIAKAGEAIEQKPDTEMTDASVDIKTGEAIEQKPDTEMTVAAFFGEVFLPWMRANKEVSTVKSYELYWSAYLKNHFNGSKTLKNYEAYVGTRFLESLCKKYSENTVNHVRSVASAIFSYACAWGYISANPWRDVKRTSSAQESEDTYAYTQTEVERIIAALENREEYNAKLAIMVISVCFYGGLRPSEAKGLKWENVWVGITKTKMHIKQAFVGEAFKNSTKTKKNRFVRLLPQLQARLKLWHSDQGSPTTGWVFPNHSGDSPVNINNISSRTIADACKKAGLDWQGLYACRRGFGTMLVLAGATLDEVADAMGNSPDIVFQNYFKDRENTLGEKGMEKLESAMAGEDKPKTDGRKFRAPLMLEAGQ